MEVQVEIPGIETSEIPEAPKERKRRTLISYAIVFDGKDVEIIQANTRTELSKKLADLFESPGNSSPNPWKVVGIFRGKRVEFRTQQVVRF